MYNEPSLINCKGFHHIPPICGFAMWGSIHGLITQQQDLLGFLNESYRRKDEDYLTPAKGIRNTPPDSPAGGDRYVIGCSPTGAWVGQGGKIAEWKDTYFWGGAKPEGTWEDNACGDFDYSDDDGFDHTWETPDQWHFTTPKDGTTIWLEDVDYFLTFVDVGNGEEVEVGGDYVIGEGNNSPANSSTTLWDDLEIDVTTIVGTAINVPTADQFGIQVSGNYRLTYTGEWSNVQAVSRWGEIRITRNGIEVPGSVVRVTATGDGLTPTTLTASNELTLSLTAGDLLKVEVRSSAISSDVYWAWETVQLRIDELTTGLGSTITTDNGDEAFWLPHHLIDASHSLLPLRVIDRATTPPGAPGLFDAYLVTATATGDWTGYENYVAISVCDRTSGARVWAYLPAEEGELVYVGDEDEYYIFDGGTGTWRPFAEHIANNHDLEDVRDVTVTAPANNDLLWYQSGTWVNVTDDDFADVIGPLINFGELGDVTFTTEQQYDLVWFDGVDWVNVTPCTMLAQATLGCLGDVDDSTVNQYDLLWWDGTTWVDVDPCTMLAQTALNCIGNVTVPTPTTGDVLYWNGSAWVDQRLDCDDVDNASTAPGATVCAALSGHETRISTNATNISNLTTTVNNIGSSDVDNNSGVPGTTVTAALDALDAAIGGSPSGSAIIIAGSFSEDGTVTSGTGFTATQLAGDVRVDLDTSITNATGRVEYHVDDVGTFESLILQGVSPGYTTTISNFTIPASGGGGRHTVFHLIAAQA